LYGIAPTDKGCEASESGDVSNHAEPESAGEQPEHGTMTVLPGTELRYDA